MSCIFCGNDNTREVIKAWEIEYKGHALNVEGIHVVECLDCERSAEGPEHGSNNDCRVADAKRHHDGLLSSREIEDILQIHGINKSAASRYFCRGQNSFSKYLRGECIQSRAVDKLLRLSRDLPDVFPCLIAMEDGDKVAPKFLVHTSVNEPLFVSTDITESSPSNICFSFDGHASGTES